MSESSKSSPEHPTIPSLNKMLWESNENVDIRIGALEKRMEKMEIMTTTCFDRIEDLLQQLVSDKTKKNPSDDTKQKNKVVDSSASQPTSSQEYGKTFPTEEITTLNLQNSQLNSMKKFVKDAWPEALLARNIEDNMYTSSKNIVVIKPEYSLKKADITVFKLRHIQSVFRIALVPYHLWAERLSHKLNEDFMGIRVWSASRPRLTWVEILYAIFVAITDHNALCSPLTILLSVVPIKESIIAFTQRFRRAFYMLSANDRNSPSVSTMITDICSKHLPRIWTLEEPKMNGLLNNQRIETVVQVTERICN
ncbi:unnamed protein product [Blumeria hordei]|uniref:Uncharacterized protein n=1 Tax=Blumeria hordei TaxID=2867405 RepID=A0A383UY32_BLUHO|nr:unnamed protein product [Blumeria hordei]